MATSKDNSKQQPDADSPVSPSPKPATLPASNRLTPSEIESLRQEARESLAWMQQQRAAKKTMAS